MADSVLVLDAPGAGVRLIVAAAPSLARAAAERHGLAPGSAAALAQAMTGALLLVAAEDADPSGARVDVQLDCRGPLRGLLVDADGAGAVRGMVQVPDLDRGGSRLRAGAEEAPPPGPDLGAGAGAVALARKPRLARFDARALLDGGELESAGMISVLRRIPGSDGELHRALVPLAGADLAAGLTSFLQGDRSRAGHVSLEVLWRAGEPLAAVAGVMIAPLAEDDGAGARALGDVLRGGGLASLLERDEGEGAGNAHQISQRIAAAHGLLPLQLRSELRPRFCCRCSRERFVRALRTLGAPELLDMADKDGGAAATCDFCAASYEVSAEELVALAGMGERV